MSRELEDQKECSIGDIPKRPYIKRIPPKAIFIGRESSNSKIIKIIEAGPIQSPGIMTPKKFGLL
ncbi:MAG: hypothetical protein N4A36_02040 [Candidatus Gracilibacteria bacterium]|jgi:hypothetical protein|nr:hypothetical protein [Candidatus Gracilibacteria bacterium]